MHKLIQVDSIRQTNNYVPHWKSVCVFIFVY